MNKLLNKGTINDIKIELEKRLSTSSHSDFWAKKVLPMSSAILSVLIPLRDQKKLINPELEAIELLSIDELVKWSDLVSLRGLYFFLKTKWTIIDLKPLEEYLHFYNVSLEDPYAEFPIRHYNLNIGIGSVLQDVMQNK